jgi:hypothetical protein
MIWKRFAELPGELTQRLKENGVEPPEDSVERRALTLAVLRAKAAGCRDVAARETGEPIQTPPRPAPIIVADNDSVPTLRGLHDLWSGHLGPDACPGRGGPTPFRFPCPSRCA